MTVTRYEDGSDPTRALDELERALEELRLGADHACTALRALRRGMGTAATARRAGGKRPEPPPRGRAAGLRSPRVLVVDDSPAQRMLATRALASAGYEVRAATDGAQAWSLLHETDFDVVVSDLQMPGLDGLGLLHRVRRSKALHELPVILNSSAEDDECRRSALAAGANEFIAKGAEMQRLLLRSVARWSPEEAEGE